MVAIVGNMLPVPAIYFLARKVLVWGQDKPVIGRFFSFCLRKGDTELLERLNKAIASMQADGTEAKLKIKWMGAAD